MEKENRWGVFLPVLDTCGFSQSGLRYGIAVAFVCTVWLVALSALHPQLPLSHVFDEFSVASAAFLLLLAFVIARWGQSEVTVMRRLALASDLSRVFSPHHSLDYALCELGETLRTYQRADMCVLIVNDAETSDWLLYEVHSGNGERPTRARRIGVELAQPLLCVPPDQAIVYRKRAFFSRRTVCSAYDWPSLCLRPTDETALSSLANLLEANCFVSLPIRSRCKTIGRVHFVSQRKPYTRGDVRFLTHIMGQAGAMIENMQFVDRLAQQGATEERKRISRDLHDGTIQPYIGLKLGLEALRRKCAPGDVLGHEVDDLLKMAGDSIIELSSYVGRLKKTPQGHQQVSLFMAVRQQAEKFSEFYGIDAQVVADGELLVKPRMFDEIMYIVREGLSNVRRHTCASKVIIKLRTSDGHLLLEFVNDNSARGDDPPEFCPRSINERATELGGRVSVEERRDGCTAVTVEIPL